MKNILIICFISSIVLFAKSGGSVINHQKMIENISKKQKDIKQHLKEIDRFLTKYNKFAGSYLSKLKSIVIEGAKCEIAKHKYLYYRKKYGEKNKFSIIRKGIYDDCYQMKENRIKAIEDIKIRVDSLKKKVNDILELKEIDIEEADRIKDYIDELRNDIRYYKNNKL